MGWQFWLGTLLGGLGGFGLAIVSLFAQDIYNNHLRPQRYRPKPEPEPEPEPELRPVNDKYFQKLLEGMGVYRTWEHRKVADHKVDNSKLEGYEIMLKPDGTPCFENAHGGGKYWYMVKKPKND